MISAKFLGRKTLIRKRCLVLGPVVFLLASCGPMTAISTPTITVQPTASRSMPSETEPSLLVYPDIPYAQIDGIDPNLLSLDVYTPLTGSGGFPVVLMLHGGSWTGGDKRTLSVSGTKSLFFTSQGCIFISINYRLAPDAKYPAPAQDVAAALAWIHSYIGHYGGDARRVYLMGHSAGGQLAALVATDEGYLAAHGLGLNALAGVILLDGVGIDIPSEVTPHTQPMFEAAFGSDPQVWREASPLAHVTPGKDIPPFLIFYAGGPGMSQNTGQEFANALTSAGVKNWLVSAPEKTHDTITADVGLPGDPVTDRIMKFMSDTQP